MTKFSGNYDNKMVLAKDLASMGARAVTITSVARTRDKDSRIVYEAVTGNPSNPGRTPTDHEWFLVNQTRRIHGAFLLVAYEKYRVAHQESPDAHGMAFTLTYRDYRRLMKGKPLVAMERANLLINGFSIGWRNISKGGASKFASANVKVLTCKRCGGLHLAEEHCLSYVCASC